MIHTRACGCGCSCVCVCFCGCGCGYSWNCGCGILSNLSDHVSIDGLVWLEPFFLKVASRKPIDSDQEASRSSEVSPPCRGPRCIAP
mmetsp:Transcript_40871/g.108016  ORF Transcript_40871/g.108016 Transcript_40871/m.108016 type:complete len:87 (-) Transcript_40871:1114-1374(-)